MMNQLKTLLLFGILTAIFVGIGAAVAPNALPVFAAIALAMNLGAYFFSDKLVLAMYRAREVSEREAPELHAIVRELAGDAGLPMPRVFVVPNRQPNAFATGRNPRHAVVAVTDGILDVLDRRELRGVLAHELAHIKNRDILISTVAAIVASAVAMVGNALTFGALFGGHRDEDDGAGAGALVMALLAPIAATLIQLAISRSREYLADETGAAISRDPEALARALVKLDRTARVVPPDHVAPATASLFIVNPFGALDRMTEWFSTHPSVESRVLRLRALVTPGAPRRAPARAAG